MAEIAISSERCEIKANSDNHRDASHDLHPPTVKAVCKVSG